MVTLLYDQKLGLFTTVFLLKINKMLSLFNFCIKVFAVLAKHMHSKKDASAV